jgi:two-component system response regulator HydG
MDFVNHAGHVLIIEDDAYNGVLTQRFLQSAGFLASLVVSAEQGLDLLEQSFKDGPDVILVSENLAGMDGIDLVDKLKADTNYRYVPVIILTAYDSPLSRIQSLNRGADDCLSKPYEPNELIARVNAVLRVRKLYLGLNDEGAVNRRVTRSLDQTENLCNLLGTSQQMKKICELILNISTTDAHVLIQGESGTGKEMLARTIHENSLRRGGPLVVINCAAHAETFLYSELFGHERGAFAGAIQRREGRFEQADGGTMLLNEIGEISLPTQSTLLRVMREQQFEPVGSTRTVKVDVRLIAASNKILNDEVRKGTFREDLFYRLNVVPILLPSLRERKEDIPLLIEHFLKIYNEKNGRNLQGFHPRALDALMRYSWPGNIRELENVVERAVILTRDDYVPFPELPEAIREPNNDHFSRGTQDIRSGMTIREMEKELILKTLKDNDGNRTRSARVLGITRRTLQHKLQEYAIDQHPGDSAAEG